MSIKSVLIIAYDWPPRNSIAVYRPYAWAKEWAKQGVAVTVLTAKKCAYDEPLDLLLPAIPGVKVLEVAYRSEPKKNSPAATTKIKQKILDLLKKYSSPIKKAIGYNYDIRDKWAQVATPIALQECKNTEFDMVLSTFGPRASHMIASQVKSVNPQIKWVADYRDLWSIRHDLDLTPTQRNKELLLEENTLQNSDLLLTVSTPLRDELSKFLNKETWVVFNGFDTPSDLVVSRFSESNHARRAKETINIIYTGLIYPKLRDPSPLFIAINGLIEENKIRDGQIKIHFYGSRQPSIQELIKQHAAESYVVLHGHVPREEAVAAQLSADFLLLLESPNPDARGVLTGKIFEYMASGKTILSIGSRKDSAIGEMIEATGTGVVCEQDVASIQRIIINTLNGQIEDFFSPRVDEILKFSRASQAANLLHDLNEKLFSQKCKL